MILKSKIKNMTIAALSVMLSVTACQQDDPAVVSEPTNDIAISATADCTAALTSGGASFSLGAIPKLPPVSSGKATFGTATEDCDYFVGFNANSYNRIVVADLDDPGAADAIRDLIRDQPIVVSGKIVGGGFGNSIARGKRTNDTRVYVVFGNARTNLALSAIAVDRLTDVRSLLARHVRLGYFSETVN